jgi:WD40 repeat protein
MPTPRNSRPNPYIGPRSFEPGERLYGRDTETRKLANLLGAERVVLLHSPSGAGKTSLVQAALIPRMRERKFHVRPVVRVNHEAARHSSNGYNRYVFSVLSSLESAWPDDQQLPDEALIGLPLPVYLALRPRPAGVNYELLIFDQFEEVLTLDPTDQAAKHAFFAQLGEALEDRTRWALFSMREDFLGALAPYVTPLPDRLSATFRLDLLGEVAARQALQQPVRAAGAEFDDAAAQALADDLRRVQVQRPDGTLEAQLGPYVEPVQLQVVGYRLWESLAEDDTQIDQADLAALGDVGHALAEYYAGRVAAIAQESGVSERAIREWCDRRLITEQGIRGQVLMGKERSEGLENRAVRLLEDAHLVRAEKRGGATWYELAHDRLIEPVRADNASWFGVHLSLLQRQAQLWADERRPDSLLLRGKELRDAEAWAEAHAGEVTETEREFLDDCRSARAVSQAQARANRRLRTALIVSVLIALVAVVFMVVAVIFGIQTYYDNRIAQARVLAAESGRQLNSGKKNLATLLAFRALKDYPYTSEAEGALGIIVRPQQQLSSFSTGHTGAIPDANLSPDGTRVVTAGSEGTVRVWDALKGKLLVTLAGHTASVFSAKFSPDGTRVVTASDDRTARLWDIASGKLLVTFSGHTSGVISAVFSPDGERVVTASDDMTARVWDTASGKTLFTLTGHTKRLTRAAFSSNGARIVTASDDNTARVWDAVSGKLLMIFDEHKPFAMRPTLSPDGARIITAVVFSNIARVLDAASGKEIVKLAGHTDDVGSAVFSPDGAYIVTASSDQNAGVWDAASGKLLAMLEHTDTVIRMAFSPDGTRIVTTSADKTLRMWDLEEHLLLLQIPRSDIDLAFTAFSADGSRLLIRGEDGLIQVWQVWPSRQDLIEYAQSTCEACEPDYAQRVQFRLYNWPLLVFEYRQILFAFWLGLFYAFSGWLAYRSIVARSALPAPISNSLFIWKRFVAASGLGGLVVALALAGIFGIWYIKSLYFGKVAYDPTELSISNTQLLLVLPLGLWAGGFYAHFTRSQVIRRGRHKRMVLGGLAGLIGCFCFTLFFDVVVAFWLARMQQPQSPVPITLESIIQAISMLLIPTLVIAVAGGIMSIIGAALYIFVLQPLAMRWATRDEDE